LHNFRQACRKVSSRSQAIQATAAIALLSSASAVDSFKPWPIEMQRAGDIGRLVELVPHVEAKRRELGRGRVGRTQAFAGALLRGHGESPTNPAMCANVGCLFHHFKIKTI
jgi:hypothetical protein